MNSNNKANGLTLITLKTEKMTGLLDSWPEIKDRLGDSAKYVVFYFDYGIRFGVQNGDKIFFQEGPAEIEKLQLDYLQLARFFDKNMELKIWRDGERKHHYRSYHDSPDNGGKTEIVEAKQILWGTRACSTTMDVPDSFTINDKTFSQIYWINLTEDRGTELVIPFHEPFNIPEKTDHPRLAVKTYNYIDYLENGLATYVDSRFVDIETVSEYSSKSKMEDK